MENSDVVFLQHESSSEKIACYCQKNWTLLHINKVVLAIEHIYGHN